MGGPPSGTTTKSAPESLEDRRFRFPKSEGSSVSDWLRDAHGDPLLNHQATPRLPPKADIVIIGSGMTGTLVASHCTKTWPDRKVLVLEAREFCSGATGRNAGHCKPDQWRGFPEFSKLFGNIEALKILENEHQTWSKVVAYVKRHNVDCDLWIGDTFDVPITEDAADAARAALDAFQEAGGKADHVKVIDDPVKAAEMSRIKDAKACYAWPASTLNPWKLAAHVMRGNLKNGVGLYTHTEVTKVLSTPGIPGSWTVQTKRGNVECSQVIHATNAYSPALEPSLRGLISPSPHICNKVNPPSTFCEPKNLRNSYGVLLPNGGLFTMNPRLPRGGSILFGGSNPGQYEFGKWLQAHPECSTDDSLSSFTSVSAAVERFAQSQLLGWECSQEEAEKYKRGWSGIIALSADSVPFIGQLPDLPGQWICAGHHGHGMARIFTAAPGLVKLMAGNSWADTGLPESFQITPSRVRKLDVRSMDFVLSRV